MNAMQELQQRLMKYGTGSLTPEQAALLPLVPGDPNVGDPGTFMPGVNPMTGMMDPMTMMAMMNQFGGGQMPGFGPMGIDPMTGMNMNQLGFGQSNPFTGVNPAMLASMNHGANPAMLASMGGNNPALMAGMSPNSFNTSAEQTAYLNWANQQKALRQREAENQRHQANLAAQLRKNAARGGNNMVGTTNEDPFKPQGPKGVEQARTDNLNKEMELKRMTARNATGYAPLSELLLTKLDLESMAQKLNDVISDMVTINALLKSLEAEGIDVKGMVARNRANNPYQQYQQHFNQQPHAPVQSSVTSYTNDYGIYPEQFSKPPIDITRPNPNLSQQERLAAASLKYGNNNHLKQQVQQANTGVKSNPLTQSINAGATAQVVKEEDPTDRLVHESKLQLDVGGRTVDSLDLMRPYEIEELKVYRDYENKPVERKRVKIVREDRVTCSFDPEINQRWEAKEVPVVVSLSDVENLNEVMVESIKTDIDVTRRNTAYMFEIKDHDDSIKFNNVTMVNKLGLAKPNQLAAYLKEALSHARTAEEVKWIKGLDKVLARKINDYLDVNYGGNGSENHIASFMNNQETLYESLRGFQPDFAEVFIKKATPIFYSALTRGVFDTYDQFTKSLKEWEEENKDKDPVDRVPKPVYKADLEYGMYGCYIDYPSEALGIEDLELRENEFTPLLIDRMNGSPIDVMLSDMVKYDRGDEVILITKDAVTYKLLKDADDGWHIKQLSK